MTSVMLLLSPDRDREVRSSGGEDASLRNAWRHCGSTLQGVLSFTAVLCLIGFYHPGLAPLIAFDQLGPKPTDLGLFTSKATINPLSPPPPRKAIWLRPAIRPRITCGAPI